MGVELEVLNSCLLSASLRRILPKSLLVKLMLRLDGLGAVAAFSPSIAHGPKVSTVRPKATEKQP